MASNESKESGGLLSQVIRYGLGPLIVAVGGAWMTAHWANARADSDRLSDERKATALLQAQVAKDGMVHVLTVLDPTLDAERRKRIYEYLASAFEGQPAMKQWADSGLQESEDELQRARTRIAELERELKEAYQEYESAAQHVREIEQVSEVKPEERAKADRSVADSARKMAQLQSAISVLVPMQLPDTSAENINEKGKSLEREGKVREAKTAYSQACDAGSMTGCFNFAQVLHRGNDANPETKKKAKELYRLACDSKVAAACTHLGDLLRSQKELQQSLRLYEEGCKKGDVRGCHELAAIAERVD